MSDDSNDDHLHRSRIDGNGVLLLFLALSFLLVGGLIARVAVVPDLYDWIRMRNWVRVDAKLASSYLATEFGKKNEISSYKVEASYRYNFEGHSYVSQRVGIDVGGDNFGHWHQDTFSRLHSMQSFKVWVNPSNPNEAIFDRDLRWGKVGFYCAIAIFPTGLGLLIIWGVFRRSKTQNSSTGPFWKSVPEWRSSQIPSNHKSGVRLIWVLAGVWNLFDGLVFTMPSELAKGNRLILVGLLFPIVGAALVVWAVRETLAWRKYGEIFLSIKPFPGVIGRDFSGTVRMKEQLPSNTFAEVVLSCARVYQTRTSEDKLITSEDIIWQERKLVHVEFDDGHSVIQFRIAIPERLPPSEAPRKPYTKWTVDVNCKLPGLDFCRRFSIPVFGSSTSQVE